VTSIWQVHNVHPFTKKINQDSELRHKEKFGTRLFLAFTTWTKEEKISGLQI